ncbi:chromo (CHRromatin Organization MOdifier) domain protein, partial [Puccinia sorghi]
ILDFQMREKQRQYLVRWKGFGLQGKSWEPVEILKNCKAGHSILHSVPQNSQKASKTLMEMVVARGQAFFPTAKILIILKVRGFFLISLMEKRIHFARRLAKRRINNGKVRGGFRNINFPNIHRICLLV